MNILLFCATGMVGQGVLRECLRASDVVRVQSVGRTATAVPHRKLREVVHQDLWNYGAIEAQLENFDACFFCLGVSSSGTGPGAVHAHPKPCSRPRTSARSARLMRP